MRAMVEQAGLGDRVKVASAGTIGAHEGEQPDARMRRAAEKRGYRLASRARKIEAEDLERFQLILTMDEENRRGVMLLAQTSEQRRRIRRFSEFCQSHVKLEVPDPYYGGPEGFERVLDLLEDGCRGVLEWTRAKLVAH